MTSCLSGWQAGNTAKKRKEGKNQCYIAGFSGDWIRKKQVQKLITVPTPCE